MNLLNPQPIMAIGDTVHIKDENGNQTGITGIIVGELTEQQKTACQSATAGRCIWPGGIRIFIVCADFGENRNLDLYCPAYLEVVQPDHSRN
jgi:hypothetical protein